MNKVKTKYSGMLKFVPDHLKTKTMSKNAIKVTISNNVCS